MMHARRIAGLVLGILTVPVLILGLMDPVEGGVALLVGGVLLLLTLLVSRVPMPRLAWIPWLSALAFGAASLIAVAQYYPWRDYPWWIWALVIGYELAAAVTAAGGVVYVVRIARRLRRDRRESSVAELAHEDAQQPG
jgi:membrane-bound ClpP family serine protease